MIYFSFYNFTGSCGTYIHVCTYLLAETCSTEMRHAYGREQKSFAVWFELICHHNLCIAVEFMRKEINTFLTFPACFLIPIIFSNLNDNCSNFLDTYKKPPGTSYKSIIIICKFSAFSFEFQTFFSITGTIFFSQ